MVVAGAAGAVESKTAYELVEEVIEASNEGMGCGSWRTIEGLDEEMVVEKSEGTEVAKAASLDDSGRRIAGSKAASGEVVDSTKGASRPAVYASRPAVYETQEESEGGRSAKVTLWSPRSSTYKPYDRPAVSRKG
mgnify:FL=1